MCCSICSEHCAVFDDPVVVIKSSSIPNLAQFTCGPNKSSASCSGSASAAIVKNTAGYNGTKRHAGTLILSQFMQLEL